MSRNFSGSAAEVKGLAVVLSVILLPLVLASPYAVSASTTTCQPDFTLTLTPASATVAPGSSVRVTVSVASVCGLSNTVNVGISGASPALGSGLSLTHQTAYDLHVSSTMSSHAVLTLTAASGARAMTYLVTITGHTVQGPEAGIHSITHGGTVTITVA
ncbi:MAG: hypothetical protein OK474_04255 [Thaumarchaeota archaeon]|nr:hypothetical protein [Nitrososphaerota archaeon]